MAEAGGERGGFGRGRGDRGRGRGDRGRGRGRGDKGRLMRKIDLIFRLFYVFNIIVLKLLIVSFVATFYKRNRLHLMSSLLSLN